MSTLITLGGVLIVDKDSIISVNTEGSTTIVLLSNGRAYSWDNADKRIRGDLAPYLTPPDAPKLQRDLDKARADLAASQRQCAALQRDTTTNPIYKRGYSNGYSAAKRGLAAPTED